MNDEVAYGDRFKVIMHALIRSPRVEKIAQLSEDQSVAEIASEAAFSILDVVESATLIRHVLIPRLTSLDPRTAEFASNLDDIAEEWRHISYHVLHTELFAYVVDRSA